MFKRVQVILLIIAFMAVGFGCNGAQESSPSNSGSPAPAGSTDNAAEPNKNDDKVYEFTFADSWPTTHLMHKAVSSYFASRLNELGNGRIKVTHYPAEQFAKFKDLLETVSTGAVDIAYVPTPYLSGQLPLNSVLILPFYTTSAQGSEIGWRMMNPENGGELSKEFAKYNIRPIVCVTTAQYDVGTVDKPIKSIDDLKGMMIMSSGGIFEQIHKLSGCNPITIAPNELYEGMQRGIVEGSFLSYYSVAGYRVNELEKYHTLGASFGAYPNVLAVNQDVWGSLPKDIQDIITQAGEDTMKHGIQEVDASQESFAKQFTEEGMEIYRLSAEEQIKWREAVAPVKDIWINDMESKGLPGQEVFDEFYKLCQEIVK